jgi:hypothetical protein
MLEFFKAVDWTEPWIIGVLLFHVLIVVSIVLLHRFQALNSQVALFGLLLILACLSETINEYGAKHWRLFARHQYFDSNGFFITCIYSGPIVINCLLIIVLWLWSTAQLVIRMKRIQRGLGSKQQKWNSSTGSSITKHKRPKEE